MQAALVLARYRERSADQSASLLRADYLVIFLVLCINMAAYVSKTCRDARCQFKVDPYLPLVHNLGAGVEGACFGEVILEVVAENAISLLSLVCCPYELAVGK